MTSRVHAETLIVLAAALAFRLALALGLPNDEPDDGRLYALLAHNVVVHGVYSANEDPPYSPTYIRVPGYPLFLAAIYSVFGDGNNTAVRVAQAAVDTATCWLVALLAVAWAPRAWPPAWRGRVRLAALGFAAACPFTAIYVATILTETLAMFLGTATVLLATWALQASRVRSWTAHRPGRLSRLGSWVLTGVAGAATALVRPEFILYAGAVGGTLLVATADRAGQPRPVRAWRGWIGRAIPSGLALTLGVVLTLAPWTIRNLRTMGVIEPLNPRSVSMPGEFVAFGYADWVRTWIDHPRYVWNALWTVDLRPIRIEEMPASAFDSAAERARVAALLAQYNTPPPDAEPDEEGQLPRGE